MDPSARCSSQNARLEPNMSSCLGVTPRVIRGFYGTSLCPVSIETHAHPSKNTSLRGAMT